MDEENNQLIKERIDANDHEPPRYGTVQSNLPTTCGGDPYRVYPGRFYVLLVFTLMAVLQCFAWMTFGTIPNESYKHFGLTDDDITLIAAYGPITLIPLAFPFMWFLDRFGLRISMLSGSWILAVGMGIRCFVPSQPGSKLVALIHLGHILIGIVGPLALITPPRLSSVWFPPKQRTFATAMMVVAQSVGTALAFIIIPYLTQHYDIHTMLYVQAELGLFSALLATLYFPSHPPTPPSESAATDRTKFWSSLAQLMCNGPFIVLAVSGGLTIGGNGGFSSVLSIILNQKTVKFTDKVDVTSASEFFHSNAWLGACTAISGAIGGQLIGLIADKIQRRFKLFLLLLLMMATPLAFWFAVSVYGYTSTNAVNLFLSLCFQYFFATATIPLFFEAAVEVTYPVPEGSSVGILNILINASVLLFQVIGLSHIFSNDHPEQARIMVWVLGGLTGLAGLILLFFKETYRRLNVDTQMSIKEGIQTLSQPVAKKDYVCCHRITVVDED